MNDMNTITAYATLIRFESMQHGEYNVIDEAASVGKEYPVVVGHVSVIRGFGHFEGNRYTHMKDISAVIALSGGSTMDRVEEALKTGLINGRDDRR
jgi:hypothetical protein